MEWTPDKIKELRKSLKLSQENFGTLVGVSRDYVIKLEKGVRKPSKTLGILMGICRITSDELKTKMKKEGDQHGKEKGR